MHPGDVLVLKHGTYKQQIVVNRSGTSRDFIAIVAENPPYDTPPKFPNSGPTVIDASGLGDKPAILLDGCGHVRVAGIKVVGTKESTGWAVELKNTRDCILEYVFVEMDEPALRTNNIGTGIRVCGRENTLYECRVRGGGVGYCLAGSLTDVKWCASEDNGSGFLQFGPACGVQLLQNRHSCTKTKSGGGYGFGDYKCSDIVMDGNWDAYSQGAGIWVAGDRVVVVNNTALNTLAGIMVGTARDILISNNGVLSCSREALGVNSSADSLLALNNVFQSYSLFHTVEISRKSDLQQIYLDYSSYSRAKPPLGFLGRMGTDIERKDQRLIAGLTAWTAATGCDRNSIVSPLICQRSAGS